MSRFLLPAVLAGLLVVSAGFEPPPSLPPVAIVAHPSSPVSALSVQDLRRIYTGEVRSFAAVCIQRRLADQFFETVADQSARAIGRRWVRLLLSGRVADGPVSLRTDAEVLAFVRDHPGAIGFVTASAVESGARVKRIAVRGEGGDRNGHLLLTD
ncbi:hypothetical protein [Rubrivirga sp. IMCC45206]|uniref:hypothetical protein n=1 Tax=Rubrivirga sp. IMCC45206 TaxID=3391614 RepID=UPI00399002F5